MADVFISYAREDRAKAQSVAQALQAQGYAVFWDSEIPPGQTWADYIESKLAQAKVMVVLWSAASTASQWVREEARIGRDKGKLIPVMLDGTPAPFGFGEVQAADLSTWTGASDHAGWRAFAGAVAARVGAQGSASESEAESAPRGPARPQPPRPAMAPGAPDPADMSPFDYVKKCFRLYLNANGRARRSEYWWWVAFTFAAQIIASIVDFAIFGAAVSGVQPLSTLLSLGFAPAGICVAIRRWHDVGLSGWLFLGAVGGLFVGALLATASPALGGLIVVGVGIGMLVVAVLPSQESANAYGPNPKTGLTDAAATFS